MKISIWGGTHLPVLMKLVSITDGPILELGGGLYSTPFLHWACFANKRELITYENAPEYFNMVRKYNCDFHKVILIDDWDKMPIDRYWDIAFIDHAPAERRKKDVIRLANFAKFVIIHDTEENQEHVYNLGEIYPLFKYRYHYKDINPHTSVLSNFVDVRKLEI